VYSVLGNHERDNARFYEFFDVKLPYYSFNWGAAHFAMLDSDVPNVASGSGARERFWTEQMRWLEDDLARSQKADFRVPIEVEGNRAHIRAIALDGHVIETIELAAPGGN
jgi:hypothetical protein